MNARQSLSRVGYRLADDAASAVMLLVFFTAIAFPILIWTLSPWPKSELATHLMLFGYLAGASLWAVARRLFLHGLRASQWRRRVLDTTSDPILFLPATGALGGLLLLACLFVEVEYAQVSLVVGSLILVLSVGLWLERAVRVPIVQKIFEIQERCDARALEAADRLAQPGIFTTRAQTIERRLKPFKDRWVL